MEKTLPGGKKEEGKPQGTDQTQQKPAEDVIDTTEIESEIDSIAGKDADVSDVEDGDEEVTITKSELEKLKRNGENYKEGLLNLKKKVKGIKKTSPQAHQGDKPPAENAAPNQSDFLTRDDFFKANEKKAIADITTENQVLDGNWDEVVKFYVPRRGKQTPEDIKADIEDAFILWAARNPDKAGTAGDGGEGTRALSNERRAPGASQGGKGGGEGKSKGGVLPKTEKIQDWYGKSK